jgi:hypothetical protein
MPINTDIPIFYAYVYGIDGTDKVYDCVVHAARSRAGKVITFHVHLKCGAHYSLVPLHKLIHLPAAKKSAPLQLWDCFSDSAECHVFSHLKFRRVKTRQHGEGEYLCTFDWLDNDYSDMAEEFKQGHMIKMDSGHFGVFPNNELLWYDKTWTGEIGWEKEIPKLVRQTESDYISAENFS